MSRRVQQLIAAVPSHNHHVSTLQEVSPFFRHPGY